MKTRPWFSAFIAMAVALDLGTCVGSTAAAPRSDSTWLDIESRIQYGYFTEDTRSLNNLTDPLWSGESQDKLKSYYAGLLAYRLTEVSSAADSVKAGWAERCVTSLDRALDLQKDFADALALQSACLAVLANLRPWRAPFATPRSATQIRKALELEPRNARVLLLDAIGEHRRSRLAGGDKERAFAKFKKAVQAFEAERQDVERVPGWGAADAYVFLARSYLEHGDAVAARDALERALLIAPEYMEAKRLMTRIISG